MSAKGGYQNGGYKTTGYSPTYSNGSSSGQWGGYGSSKNASYSTSYTSNKGPGTTYSVSKSYHTSFSQPILYGGGVAHRSHGNSRHSLGSVLAGYRARYRPGGHRPVFMSGSEVNPALRADDQAHPTSETIQPVAVNFYVNENRTAHNTNSYETEDLILRRGQEFKVTVTFDKPIRQGTDKLKLQFTVGKDPQESKGTLIRINISKELDPKNWSAIIDSRQEVNKGEEMTFKVMPAPDAIIGKYTMFVETWRKAEDGSLKQHRHKCKQQLILLFNAWCPNDSVYMENAKEREEYVLNDTGRIFVGQAQRIHGRPWFFGQFEPVVLEATLYLLEISYLGDTAQSNPTLVSRALSAMANANDQDGGVMEGNWSGNYTGGRSPTAWNGSVAALEEYMLTKRTVKFAQCWVFSGLITTLCRAIGIPSRSVTNFDSAHDTDFSMTIDQHVDQEGRPLKNMDDSVWNFHVWNEVWFRRPDLPPGNDGWQAIDATPQEASDKMMRCGPAPLAAVKAGNVFLGYDTKFIFAEVNGDRVTWMMNDQDDMEPLEVSQCSVGHQISTKAVGSDERMDITSLYKHTEGCEEEREAVRRASEHSSRKDLLAKLYNIVTKNDVTFSFKGNMAPNGNVTFTLKACNKSDEQRDIDVRMYANAVYYTGVPGEELASKCGSDTLAPGEEKEKTWDKKACDYFNLLDEDATIGIYVLAKVTQTKQVFTARETFWVDKPDLDVQASTQTPKVGQECKIIVKFTNPIDVTLTNIELTLEGPCRAKDRKIAIHRNLKPNEEMKESIPFTPKLPGKREIIVSLRSKQLTGIDGTCKVEIQP